MKLIELGSSQPTLDEVIGLAIDEPIVLRRSDGSIFAVTHVDEFALEVDALKNNQEFMQFLRELSQEKAVISLEDLRLELGV